VAFEEICFTLALLAQDPQRDRLKDITIVNQHSIFFTDICGLMKNFLFQNKLLLIGIVSGAIAGFLYWKLVGCSGSCSITSTWHNSSAYGAVMGGLLLSIFKREPKN
jgi:hypothetical protein